MCTIHYSNVNSTGTICRATMKALRRTKGRQMVAGVAGRQSKPEVNIERFISIKCHSGLGFQIIIE